jgi:transposase
MILSIRRIWYKNTSKTKNQINQEYQVLEWPPQSPDLNPIENMWRLLKIRLNEHDTPPKGMQELYESHQGLVRRYRQGRVPKCHP